MSDSRWRGVRPHHDARCPAEANRSMSPDLSDHDRSDDRPDAGDLLDGVVAGVVGEDVADRVVELADLVIERVDQHQQRLDPLPERRREPVVGLEQMGEELTAAFAEQIRHRHVHAPLRDDRVDLGFEPRPQGHELGPIADQLTMVASVGGGDPCLGQHVRPQQVSQDLTVELIVLDPAPLERRQPRRRSEMHLDPCRLQRVDRPVPACGGRILRRGWSGRVSVLVDQAVAPGCLDDPEPRGTGVGVWRGQGWSLVEGAVGSVFVVVVDVVDDDTLELPLVPDDGAVEKFSADGADPAFGERVGHRSADGRLEDIEALGVEDLVEGVDELAAPNPAGAEYYVVPGQAAFRYSWMRPPHRVDFTTLR